MIRKYNGSNNSLFLSFQMGLSDGAFFMIKYTPLPNGNHSILSPVCPMGIADTLGPYISRYSRCFLIIKFYRQINAFQIRDEMILKSPLSDIQHFQISLANLACPTFNRHSKNKSSIVHRASSERSCA